MYDLSGIEDRWRITPSVDEDWYGHYQKGLEASRQGSFSEALEHFDKANKGELDGWLDEKLLKMNKYSWNYPFLWKRRAFALAKLGQFRDALSNIQLAVCTSDGAKEHPLEMADRLLLEADIQEALGNNQAALESLNRAVQYLHQTDSQSSAIHEKHFQAIKRRVQPWDSVETKRIDPVVRMPAEIIERIMQLGLRDDELFVLKATPVSRRWHTLLKSLLPLWQTFTWTGSNTRDEHRNLDRHSLWVSNNGGKFQDVKLTELVTTGLPSAIASQWKWKEYFGEPSNISLQHRQFAHRSTKLNFPIIIDSSSLRSLHLSGARVALGWGSSNGHYNSDLTLGVLTEKSASCLVHLALDKLQYVFLPNATDASPRYHFDSLETFTVTACDFPLQLGRKLYTEDTAGRVDHLHFALAQMPNLRKLDISNLEKADYMMIHPRQYNPQRQRFIELKSLTSLRIPSPAFWAIHITTPSLTELCYVPEDPVCYEGEQDGDEYCALLPNLDTLAPTRIPIHDLIRVELAISPQDITKNLLRALSITNCLTDPATLLEYVSSRRNAELDVSRIEEIHLYYCSYIPDAIWHRLSQELALFENVEYDWITRRMWKELNEGIEQRRQRDVEYCSGGSRTQIIQLYGARGQEGSDGDSDFGDGNDSDF
ncbi:hypothetical protein QFC21_001448 [Naganishia friedmannii]|uniref:Uncharacterized protein n=1 Tax=Naganishia friedmannii TaxID=89922 RepID=A0ACC2W4H1_9TREE|nr:hypothetical protein QFC21_001448 [Naganishia friedmannii]